MHGTRQGSAIGIALAIGAVLGGVPGQAQPIDTARIAAGSPNDWLSYRGAYNGWNYSGLDQINTASVKDIGLAWIHVPGRSTRGLQSVPLVADRGIHRRSALCQGNGGDRQPGR
jgi:alcohol dehydrogenase (cytochrome c)